MHKSKYLGKLALKLAQISQEADDSGSSELAQKIDVILEDVSNQAQQGLVEVAPEVTPEVTPEVKIAEAKLSKKQKSSLRGFYRAASRMADNVSVGRREFPDHSQRSAMGKIMASVDNGLDLLEEFNGVVTKKDQIERQASADKTSKADTATDSELRLYAALKEKMAKEDIVNNGILTSEEVDDLEAFAFSPEEVASDRGYASSVQVVQPSDEMISKIREMAANGELEKILDMDSQKCQFCKGRILDGRCSGCGEDSEVVEPVQRSMAY